MFKNNNKFYSIILSLKQLKNSKFVGELKNKFLKEEQHNLTNNKYLIDNMMPMMTVI